MSSRDHRLDAAKGVLIFMVVLGHIMAAVSPWDDASLRIFQTAIYAFHMPAFVFLTGMTARSGKIPHRVAFLLVLLATALPLYYGWMSMLGLEPEFDFLVPYWVTWFLLALVWWLLTVPLIERFPRAMLSLSLVAGLFGGLIPEYDYELSIARALTFWPFFVIGKLYGRQILSWAGSGGLGKRAGLLGAALVPVGVFYAFDVEKFWFYGSRGFEFLDATIVEGSALRGIIALGAMLSTMAVLAWVPRSAGFWAAVGRRSLAVYLLHGFMVRALNRPLDDILEVVPGPVMVLVCFILAALATWFFALPIWDEGIRRYGEGVIRLATAPSMWVRATIRKGRERRAQQAEHERIGQQVLGDELSGGEVPDPQELPAEGHGADELGAEDAARAKPALSRR